MNVHKNARLTAHSRAELVRRVVDGGQPPKAVATAFGVDVKTVRKWVERFRSEGSTGLMDRSSRPRRLHRPTPSQPPDRIIPLRRHRWPGQPNAQAKAVPPATATRRLRPARPSRQTSLDP